MKRYLWRLAFWWDTAVFNLRMRVYTRRALRRYWSNQ
jgi:hypothetical protein